MIRQVARRFGRAMLALSVVIVSLAAGALTWADSTATAASPQRQAGHLAPLEIDPAATSWNVTQAQAQIDASLVTLHLGLPVPTLECHVWLCGWWSWLPMGTDFLSSGREYAVIRRVRLSVQGGRLPLGAWGGDLDLHTCLPGGGSTLTWARLAG